MSSVLTSPVAVDARLVPTTSVPSRYVAQVADHFGRQVHDPLAQLVADALRVMASGLRATCEPRDWDTYQGRLDVLATLGREPEPMAVGCVPIDDPDDCPW